MVKEYIGLALEANAKKKLLITTYAIMIPRTATPRLLFLFKNAYTRRMMIVKNNRSVIIKCNKLKKKSAK